MNWTAETLTGIATDYWRSAALIAAVELDLFEHLATSPRSLDQINAKLSAVPAHLCALLDALCALQIATKTDAGYALAEAAAPYLLSSSDRCMIDALRLNASMYRMWGALGNCVREGSSAVPAKAHLGDDETQTRIFVMGMHSRATAFAGKLTALIALEDRASLLDIGSGPGTFSRALAATNPSLAVTQFDLPGILAVARELTPDDDIGRRITFHPGDYRVDPLPGDFDAVLYCGALHQENVHDAQHLFSRVLATLRPGGALIVVDFMLNSDRTSPVFSALFALNMLLVKPDSRVYTTEEVQDLLTQAGFTPATVEDHAPYSIIRTTRPQ
jgi:SAM-dependent methyltransferase|tara:strand:- start:720 stop:1709 length:990 start_codon:yes stop_codon:yes gene_type:complete